MKMASRFKTEVCERLGRRPTSFLPAAAPTLEPMSLLLSGQSVNFSLNRIVSMQELIRPRIVQSGLSVTLGWDRWRKEWGREE